MFKRLVLAALAVLSPCAGAMAVSHTFTITLPTTRTDGSALPLSMIGNAVVYDTSVPSPGLPGTPVTCSPALVFPPTTATLTCAANVTGGHGFVANVSDAETPPDTSASSNQVMVPAVAAPNAPTLSVQ